MLSCLTFTRIACFGPAYRIFILKTLLMATSAATAVV